MATTSTFPLVDRILDGTLASKLKQWREEDKTYEDIAFLLRSEHDIKVSTATVGRWVIDSGAASEADQ